MRVLFTGGGGVASESLAALLPQHDVHFADANPDTRPDWLPAERWHVIPTASTPGFYLTLEQLCRKAGIALLVPGVDEELLGLAMARTMGFPCRVLLPHESFVGLHLDKLRSMRTLAQAGILVPRTDRLLSADWRAFPVVVKPREGRGSRHIAIVHTEEELQAHVLLSRLGRPSFLVQELLVGQEYTVTMVADQRGTLRAVVPVRVAEKRGITIRGTTEADQDVIDACQKIHAVQPVSGIYNVQCIKAADGTVQPFEINPRISTTTCVAMAAGVDVLGLALAEDGLAPFQHGLTVQRAWRTTIA